MMSSLLPSVSLCDPRASVVKLSQSTFSRDTQRIHRDTECLTGEE